MKKRFLFPLIGVGTLSAIAAVGFAIGNDNISKCNAGKDAACQEIARIHGTDYSFADQITNPVYQEAVDAIAAKEKAEADAAEATARRNAEEAKRLREEALAQGEWHYSTYVDDATGKKAKTAALSSKNSMNFGFPYSGVQYGRFTVRNHPRHGVDAFLQIQEGQLLCDSYSNTNVLVRFDDGPATRYRCGEPADHSSTVVFIQNVAALEAGMKTAKKMYVTVSVYQEGSRTWEFNVTNYDRSKV